MSTHKMKNLKLFTLILAVALLICGCGTNPTSTPSTTAVITTKPWTVMVYIAADNDLAPYVDQNIMEMEQGGGSTDYTNIIVLADKPNVNTKRYYIVRSTDTSRVTSPYEDYGRNVNTGDANELKSFVETACHDYPAQNYMLILSGHAGGIMDSSTVRALSKNIYRNICSDDTYNMVITTPQLGNALKELTPTYPIKVLAADACCEGMFEIAYELKGADINYLVLSEYLSPGDGFPYEAGWLSGIISTTTGAEISVNLVNDFYTKYEAKGNQSVTLAAINLSKFSSSGIITRYNNLATALEGLGDDDINKVKNTVIPATQHYASENSKYYYNYLDIKDFCKNLSDNAVAATEATALYNDFDIGADNVIIASIKYTAASGGDLNVSKSYGMSTLICNPIVDSFSQNWQSFYYNLKYYTDGNTKWSDFLKIIAP